MPYIDGFRTFVRADHRPHVQLNGSRQRLRRPRKMVQYFPWDSLPFCILLKFPHIQSGGLFLLKPSDSPPCYRLRDTPRRPISHQSDHWTYSFRLFWSRDAKSPLPVKAPDKTAPCGCTFRTFAAFRSKRSRLSTFAPRSFVLPCLAARNLRTLRLRTYAPSHPRTLGGFDFCFGPSKAYSALSSGSGDPLS